MGNKKGIMIDKDKATIFTIVGTDKLIVMNDDVKTERTLMEANESEIFVRRVEMIPTFVLKIEDKLYITDIDYNTVLTFNSEAMENEHMCVDCKFCRALPKEMGGCEKVKDCSVRFFADKGNKITDAVEWSKRIEKYPFIEYGYETFGVRRDVLCVSKCKDFKPIEPRPKVSYKKSLELRHSIDQFYFN